MYECSKQEIWHFEEQTLVGLLSFFVSRWQIFIGRFGALLLFMTWCKAIDCVQMFLGPSD